MPDWGSASAAGAGAEALQQVLRDKFEEAYKFKQLKLQQDQLEEQRQQRELDRQQRGENAQYLNEQRAAATEKLKGDAAAKGARDQQVQSFLADPNLSPAVRQWAQGASLGFNQLGVHDYESPDAHRTHLDAETQRKNDDAFEQHKRTRDYDNAHQAPVRIRGVVAPADDPTLPRGTQRYLAQIAAKHGGDPNAAMAELNAYINDPSTQADHPNMSPMKAIESLRRIMGVRAGAAAAGGGDDLDSLIDQATANLGGSTTPVPRAGGPSRFANVRVVGGRSAQGSNPAGDAQLAERAKAVLQQRGFAATPENVQKFLNAPGNRARLAGGQ